MDGYHIGIDLGTTYSCVGFWQDDLGAPGEIKGRAEIVTNERGNKITPSVVSFRKGSAQVGEAAKKDQPRNPEGTISCIKRIIGRSFTDPVIAEQMNNPSIAYRIVEQNGLPVVSIKVDGTSTRNYSPVEVSRMVLEKLKDIVLERIGGAPGVDAASLIRSAVITVPAYFNEVQRTATREAGEAAGLRVAAILNEPTAAAMAYGLKAWKSGALDGMEKMLVFDFGGGTFDVTVLTTNGRQFNVLATSGDNELGGEDFDSRLVDHVVHRFQVDNGGAAQPGAKQRLSLKAECTQAKESFVSREEADVEVVGFRGGEDLFYTITRAEFESVCDDLFLRLLRPLQDAINQSKLNKIQIDTVLMVGGSSRMKKVQEMVRNFFDNRNVIQNNVDEQEAIAEGATIYSWAVGLNPPSQPSSPRPPVQLSDVTAFSLGIKTEGNVMTFLIPRNTQLPARGSKFFGAMNQEIKIDVFQGEDSVATNNRCINQITLGVQSEIPPGEIARLQVEFNLSAEGCLDVVVSGDVETSYRIERVGVQSTAS